LPEKGWHKKTLLNPNNGPLKGPYFKIACLAYSEQLGSKRHETGIIPLKIAW